MLRAPEPASRRPSLDDQRTEAILRHHLKMPDDLWDVHKASDLGFPRKKLSNMD
jgi:hypothetical protein